MSDMINELLSIYKEMMGRAIHAMIWLNGVAIAAVISGIPEVAEDSAKISIIFFIAGIIFAFATIWWFIYVPLRQGTNYKFGKRDEPPNMILSLVTELFACLSIISFVAGVVQATF